MSEEIVNSSLGKRKASSSSSSTTTSSKKQASILSFIIELIRNHKSPVGTSLQKILKENTTEFTEKQVKNALKKYTSDETLIQNKNSYLVKGETYEDTNKVQIEELIIGNKSEKIADKGNNCKISYVGKLENKKIFDKGTSFEFQIGGGDVIKGFDASVIGMKIGGKRRCTIPPELGYGKKGSAPDIPPNSTLIFDITLLDIF